MTGLSGSNTVLARSEAASSETGFFPPGYAPVEGDCKSSLSGRFSMTMKVRRLLPGTCTDEADGHVADVTACAPVPQRPVVDVFGELFAVDLDPDLGIVLEHPRWSLVGYGDSIREAEQLLIRRALELAEVLEGDLPTPLDLEGQRLRDYGIRLRGVRTIPRLGK